MIESRPAFGSAGDDHPLRNLPQSQWVCDMIAYYQKQGHYRAEDVYRALGHPTETLVINRGLKIVGEA